MLYTVQSQISDNQFLMIDLSVLFPICIFQSLTKSYHILTVHVPPNSIFSYSVLFSISGAIVIQFLFQLIPYITISEKLGKNLVECRASLLFKEEDPPCSINTALYLVSYL